MKATDIKEIEAMTGAKVMAATKETSSFNSDFVLLNDNGVIRQAFTVRDINGKMCITAMYDSESIAAALAYLNMSDEELAQNIEYINPENNTPSTMNANETTELTHAGQCLDIYLHNTAEIYDRYTVPAIEACVKAQSVKTPEMWEYIKQALKAAARLVIKYDGVTPTADDIKAVSANYVAYITESAEYQATTA